MQFLASKKPRPRDVFECIDGAVLNHRCWLFDVRRPFEFVNEDVAARFGRRHFAKLFRKFSHSEVVEVRFEARGLTVESSAYRMRGQNEDEESISSWRFVEEKLRNVLQMQTIQPVGQP